MKNLILAITLIGLVVFTACQKKEENKSYSFSAERKDATNYTAKINEAVYDLLDFSDNTAIENAERGFIAALIDGGYIEGIVDIPATQFMMGKEAPAEVNPSLWRHAQIVNKGGLYEVLEDKIYQVRGTEVNNLTILETETGIVLYDVNTVRETFIQAYKLYAQHRGDRPLRAIIVSHPHADHYGGILGTIDLGIASEDDFTSGRIPVYVPEHFLEEAISENVVFGNVMSRRALYQFGYVLPKSPQGTITDALGPVLPNGVNSFPLRVEEITEDNLNITIDGVDFEFMLAPETEAPVNMVFMIPEWNALTMAEIVNHLQHNIYTMRGAQIRDAKKWSDAIHNAIVQWGNDAEVIFSPHTWPQWGNENVLQYLKAQRDLYKAIFDQTARLANHGYRPREIAQLIDIPAEIKNDWANRDYYGQFENNVIATYVNNLGWFNANPTELARHTDQDAGRRYVEVFGGEDVVIKKAIEYFELGDYRFVVDLLNNIVAYNGNNVQANYLMADAFEQLGYQEESTLARNWYLMAAAELRSDELLPQMLNSAGPDVLNAIPSDMMMDVLASQIVPEISVREGRIAFIMKLNGDSFGIEVENGVLNASRNYTPKGATVTVSMDNPTLFAISSGILSLEEAENSGAISLTGNADTFSSFINTIDKNIPNAFNLVKPRF